MNKVIGLDRQPVDQGRTIGMESEDAKVALRALLEKMESGEITTTKWLFVYDAQCPRDPAMETTRVLDSGITVERAVWMVESVKFVWMKQSFGDET